jgi:hypothetical protein
MSSSSSTDDSGAVNDGTSEEFTCLSQKVYVESGNQKKVLHLLSIGLLVSDTNDDPLFSFDSEPWCMLPKTTEMRPVNSEFAKEIIRRSTVLRIHPTPRPSNWPKSLKIEWLQTHPVQDSIDVSFLRGEVLRLKEILERSLVEERQQREMLGLDGIGVSRGGNWRGLVPHLRLILTLTQDNIKYAFLRRADAQSRQELDARNSESRYVLNTHTLAFVSHTNSPVHRFTGN